MLVVQSRSVLVSNVVEGLEARSKAPLPPAPTIKEEREMPSIDGDCCLIAKETSIGQCISWLIRKPQ